MVACPGDLAYGVGKAAAVYMTRQLAVDYAKQGIAVNAVVSRRRRRRRGANCYLMYIKIGF